MSTIQKYWRKTVKFGGGDREFAQAPLVTCEDGFHMSVQASRHHYCSPREIAGNASIVAQPINEVMDGIRA